MSGHGPEYRYHPFFDGLVRVSPPDEPFISLTQAITWIAFECWVDPRTLYVAIDMTCHETEIVRSKLCNATEIFLRCARDKRLLLKGRYANQSAGPLAITPIETIDPKALWEYRRFDLLIDGLGLGYGVACPRSPDEFVYEPADEAFHDVRVERSSFLAEFMESEDVVAVSARMPPMQSSRPIGAREQSLRKKPGPAAHKDWPTVIAAVAAECVAAKYARPLERGEKAAIQTKLLSEMSKKGREFSDDTARRYAEEVIAMLPMRPK